MSYTTSSQVKTYLGTTSAADDTLILSLITRAQAAIDIYTGRKFEHSSVGATRYFTVGKDTYGRVLVLDEDLCKIDEIITDADGTPTTVLSTEYVARPRNIKPYSEIKLLSSTTKSWTYTDDPETGITVTGKWSYSTDAPADIQHACVRLAAYYYRQRDAQVFDVTAVPDAGIITVPKGIPADVKMILDPYRRIVI
jgi:hypothetical protein